MGGKTGGRKRGSKDSKKRNRRTLTEDEKTARKAKIRERNNSLANAAKRSFMSLFKTADKGIDTNHDQEEHSHHSSTSGKSGESEDNEDAGMNNDVSDDDSENGCFHDNDITKNDSHKEDQKIGDNDEEDSRGETIELPPEFYQFMERKSKSFFQG